MPTFRCIRVHNGWHLDNNKIKKKEMEDEHGKSREDQVGAATATLFCHFLGFFGYSLMITVFTPMLLHAHQGFVSPLSSVGHRTILLGVLLALYPLGQCLGSPVLGALSDHHGRRKVLLFSLVWITFFYVITAAALTFHSLLWLMIASFFAGLGEANTVVAQSAIADVASDTDRNRLFGYIYLSASAAYIISPLIGSKLAVANLATWFGYATPFSAVCIVLFVSFGCLLHLRKPY